MQVQLEETKQEEKPKKKFTIVAFQYNKQHSVLYDIHGNAQDIAHDVVVALENRNADVISIRRVYPCQPYPQPTT
jgi:hypothetical protein